MRVTTAAGLAPASRSRGLPRVVRLGLLGLTVARLAAAPADDRAALLAGVAAIAVPGIPGTVSLVGPEAFAVATARSDGAQAAVVAASRVGPGRVVAWGHNGYLNRDPITVGDTGRFWVNVVRWAGGREAPRVMVLRAPALAEHLEGQGLAAVLIAERPSDAELGDADVVCLDAHGLADRDDVDRLRAVLARGGGLVVAATGWGWVQLNPGKSLRRDALANSLLVEAGLAFTAGMTERGAGSTFVLEAEPSPYLHGAAALDALLAQRDGRQSLTPEELRQATVTLTQAGRALNQEDTVLVPRLKALLTDAGEPIVPTRDQPVRSRDGLTRLILTLEADRLEQTPAEAVLAHPAAADFPGAVPADAPRLGRTLRLDTSIPRWHSTGLYAAPGEKLQVRVPAAAAGRGLEVRIGCHTDGLWPRPEWWRFPAISRRFALAAAETTVANAFGGLVYVVVPASCDLGEVEVTVSGAVPAPLYVHGVTAPDEWRRVQRQHPAPWAELASRKVIITVPAEHVRALDDPGELMGFWDGVLDACADLATVPRARRSPERYVADRQISAGYMHSGYPIMTFLDAAPRFVDVDRLRTRGDWGMFHEMGHNHQHADWTFGGATEVTVNLFSLYVLDTCCPEAPKHAAIQPEKVAERSRRHLLEKQASFEAWKTDPFTALVMYVQVQQAFGWDAFKRVFAEYRALPAEQRPKTDDEKRDQWLTRLSRQVGRNLGPFFEAWGVPTSAAARTGLEDLPVWLPPDFPPAPG